MAQFVIHGNRRLNGTFMPGGNKNAVLPMLAACTLTDAPVTLENIPLIEDVRTMLAILAHLGVAVDLKEKEHAVTLCAQGLRRSRLPDELCRQVRSSILFAGPLAARIGRATLAPPGGDVIGRRRMDTHFEGLRALGIEVGGSVNYVFRRRALHGADLVLDEASVTATENIVMAAVLAPGATTIFNAACEPHVQDLCSLLNKMGARIRGVGTNLLRLEGVDTLYGATHRVQPDLIELGSFLTAAAVTGGELVVGEVCAEPLAIAARTFRKLGVQWTIQGAELRLATKQKLKIVKDFGAAVPKIEDGVWPAFPSDLMSVAIVAATQASGAILFFEKMFESRMYFVDQLQNMGAHIIQCDPHRVIVVGSTRLRGSPIASPDIRAGMALLIAALCAKGVSTIGNAQNIDRGYERVEEKLRALGADIERKE
jgi:UDP-N-acetylglucosamine 1-carboxyvinyltransferase